MRLCNERLFAGTRQLVHNIKMYYYCFSILETHTLFPGQENRIENMTENYMEVRKIFLILSNDISCCHNLLSHHKEQNNILLCVFRELRHSVFLVEPSSGKIVKDTAFASFI